MLRRPARYRRVASRRIVLAVTVAGLSSFGLSACGVSLRRLRPAEYDDARAHSVFVDGDGHPLRPDSTRRAATLGLAPKDDSLYGDWIHGILMGLKASGRHDI